MDLERLEGRQLLSTFEVTSASDSGPGTLRTAIEAANAEPGADSIRFNIAGDGVHRITLASNLPSITDPVLIDGYSQPGARPNTSEQIFDAVIRIEIRGEGEANVGLSLAGPGHSTIRGLAIGGFESQNLSGNFGLILFSDDNRIEGNIIGADATGMTVAPIDYEGIRVNPSMGNAIGGTNPEARNVIVGSAARGVTIMGSGVTVQGNLIGLSAAGDAAIPNGRGVEFAFGASDGLVGGAAHGARNVISGNRLEGFPEGGAGVAATSSTRNITIQGNYIGTDVTGTYAIPNEGDGVTGDPTGLIVGGDRPGEGNLISGNSADGVALWAYGAFRIQGNRIGTDVTGTVPLPNGQNGVRIHVYKSTEIDGLVGASPCGGNLVAYNGWHGLFVDDLPYNGSGDPPPVPPIQVIGNWIRDNGLTQIRVEPPEAATITPPGPDDHQCWDPLPIPSSPSLVDAGRTTTGTIVNGSFTGVAGFPYTIRFFGTPIGGAATAPEELGSVVVTPGQDGVSRFSTSLPRQAQPGTTLTAVAVAFSGDTSDAAAPVVVDDLAPPASPSLIGASRVADGTWVWGTLSGFAGLSYTLTFYGTPADPAAGPAGTAIGSIVVVMDADGLAEFDTVLDVKALPGSPLWAVAHSESGGDSALSAPVTVSERVPPAAPVLLNADRVTAGTSVQGTFAGVERRTYELQFYGTPFGSTGASLLGSLALTTGDGGQAAFQATLGLQAQPGTPIWALATDPDGLTSPASNPVVVGNLVPPRVIGFRRWGVHAQPTRLAITFDADMNASQASDTSSYKLLAPGRDGQLGTSDDRSLPIALARYDATARVATVRSRFLLPLRRMFRLVIRSGALTDTSGVALDGNNDGQPGGAAVFDFGGAARTHLARKSQFP
jgi:hypothetical protein